MAAKTRASAPGDDNYDARSDNKESWRSEKVKLLPSTRSVSISSQDGQPESRAKRGTYTRSVSGQSVTVVSAKGRRSSSSSPATSSDEDCTAPRHTHSTKPYTRDGYGATASDVAKGMASRGRKGSCSSFQSYNAESVRSNSSGTNLDHSSEESLSAHGAPEDPHEPTNINNANNSPAYSNSPRVPRTRQTDLLDPVPHSDTRSDSYDSRAGTKDLRSKPSPSISSNLRFGRKNKNKIKDKSPSKFDSQGKGLDSDKTRDTAKAENSRTETLSNPELSAKRSDSFEEVYDSNVNRLLETMQGSTSATPGRGQDKKPRWKDMKVRPGPTGKSPSFVFQQSLSLNEELVENARWYKSFDECTDLVVASEVVNELADNDNSTFVGIDNEMVATTSIEELLSSGCHERAQQQLSGEEGKMSPLKEDTVSDNHNTVKADLTSESGTKTNSYSKDHDAPEKKISKRPQTYLEQHATLLSRTPDREIPESIKMKLCRAGSAASDTLSVIAEASESGRDNASLTSNDRRYSHGCSDGEASDTLFRCNSGDSFTDDDRSVSLFQESVKGHEKNTMEMPDFSDAVQVRDVNIELKSCSSTLKKETDKGDFVLLIFDNNNDRGEPKISEEILERDRFEKTDSICIEKDEESTDVLEAYCGTNDSVKANMSEKCFELDDTDKADNFQEDIDNNSQGSSLVSLADSNPECYALEKATETNVTLEKFEKSSVDEGQVTAENETDTESIGGNSGGLGVKSAHLTNTYYAGDRISEDSTSSPPLASSCKGDNGLGDNGNDDNDVGNADVADDDGDDSSSSRTSAGSHGKQETLLEMALRAERENRLLERERVERAREQAERNRLEASEQRRVEDHLNSRSAAPSSKLRPGDPDNDSLTSGHLSVSSRDESLAGQGGGRGFLNRLKTRALRKGYLARKPSVTNPRK